MCWYTNLDKHNKKKIATSDIDVCKVGYGGPNGEFYPYYQASCFTYKANEVTEEIKLKMNKNKRFPKGFIEKGYHSYRCDKISIRYDIETNMIVIVPKNGCYGLITCDVANQIVGDFYIPKGSEYYENENGELVSSKLIYRGKLQSIF
jgi:hypothetical protein